MRLSTPILLLPLVLSLSACSGEKIEDGARQSPAPFAIGVSSSSSSIEFTEQERQEIQQRLMEKGEEEAEIRTADDAVLGLMKLEQQSEPEAPIVMDKEKSDTIIRNDFSVLASLDNVEGGSAYGTAKAVYENGEYNLLTTFIGLPPLEDGYFYEGWVVRAKPFSAISTGPVEFIERTPVNTFASHDDLTDHTRYVLTREPDDGDPAPADHVMEGTFNAY